MADKEKDDVSTNVTTKPALITDLGATYVNKEAYSYARNIDRATHEGDLGALPNSIANKLCITLNYQFIGAISLNDDRFVIFSGDDDSSEIGIMNEKTCIYTRVITADCLNFKTYSPITGVAKITDKNEIIIYFRDDVNPIRRMNLSNIPYKYTFKDDTCSSKEYTNQLDCDEIMLFPKISVPCITLNENPSGNLPNGTYSVLIAYSVDGQIYSDYYGLTNRIQLYSRANTNGFSISLLGLDRDFDQYDVVVIQDAKGAKTAFRLGSYYTSQSLVIVDDLTALPTVNLSDLIIQKRTWDKAGLISANSNYLIFGNLTKKPTINYQPQAMEIKADYVIEQVPMDYYEKNPKDISYYRDENYDFAIQWINSQGEYSNKFHIPGRKKKKTDEELASGDDVYENDPLYNDLSNTVKIEKWQVYNTAGAPISFNNTFINNRRTFGWGEMGYYQSTEKYGDDVTLYGEENTCTPIRYHKFPDECIVPRYTYIEGKQYLNILGVRFKNIAYPRDAQGKPIPNIVGYRIIRSDRFGGNKTVIARGICTNLRYYNDIQIDEDVWYTNYPYNDLNPDHFLSSKQTVFKKGRESSFKPLTGVHYDKYAFFTPHAYFSPTYKLGSEIKFEAEEIASVRGYFEPTFGHPKNALLTQFAFWVSITIGTIESLLIESGKQCITRSASLKTGGTDSGRTVETGGYQCINSVDDLVGLDPVSMITDAIQSTNSSIGSIISTIKQILTALAAAGLKIALFGLNALKYAENTLRIIDGFTGRVNYVYQYNAHGLFNQSICQPKDNRRRLAIEQPERITSNLHTVNNTTLNNFGGPEYMLLQLNKPILPPVTIDNTRQTISDFGICADPTAKVNTTASAFYATSKIKNVNQYGQLGTAPSVLASDCLFSVAYDPLKPDQTFTSGVVFGGDCIITKFAIQNKHQFFRQNLATTIKNELSSNFPDDTPYDYRLYRNVAYPRYWMDTTAYNFSELLSKKIINFSKFSRTTTAKYNLDCKFQDKENVFRVDNAYMYTSNNGVLEFYVETDFNISFREDTHFPHYSKRNAHLSEIFQAPRLWFDEEFKLDVSFTRLQTPEVLAIQLPDTFKNSDNDNLEVRNGVIYSLPSFNSQTVDNWRYFLPNNYFTFNKSDYGNLTAIQKIDQDRLLYLFDRASPFVSPGVDEIQTLDGRKVQIGDGGMFAHDPREVRPTDTNYGSCQSKYAFSSNEHGYFYPSSVHGRYFNFADGLTDVARESGNHFWHKQYMPIRLYSYFPDYPTTENPLSGVGYLSVYDSMYETQYLCKRDFIPKKEYVNKIRWDGVNNTFRYNEVPIKLRSEYFDDISWTTSYSGGDKSYISWHDWHPDWTIQTETHFLTVKDNTIWKHNDRCDLFCNYYGIDYPFSIEVVDTDGQIVSSRRNVEYQVEVYHYKNNCLDKFHVLGENFSTLEVWNTEQASPILNLVANPQTKYGAIEYPKKNGNRWDVLFTKEEQKYRVNQFWDATKDRGEFTNNEFHLFVNHESGYKRIMNPLAFDILKPENERKKFRHYFTKFRFSKEVSGKNRFLIRLFNFKKQQSQR